MKTILNERQTLFDLALCECGSVEATFELAALNDMSLTITAQSVVNIPCGMAKNRIVKSYAARHIVPATAINDQQGVSLNAEYVDVRFVNNDFIETRTYGN